MQTEVWLQRERNKYLQRRQSSLWLSTAAFDVMAIHPGLQKRSFFFFRPDVALLAFPAGDHERAGHAAIAAFACSQAVDIIAAAVADAAQCCFDHDL